jgi:predicted alpha/beta superfamily hydrolase
MGSLFFIILVAAVSCRNTIATSDNLESFSIHSAIVNDEFTITIKRPQGFHKDGSYHLLLIADGSIGLGEYVLGTNSNWKASHPSNCIIVTVGHIGDWHEKRRRDFIPSDAGGHKDKNFGRADLFYSFLKTELLPAIERKLPNLKSRSFIGHSFSGLFSLYTALKNESLFDHYYAISPSVWANDKELIKILDDYKTNGLKTKINIYVGGLEIFNKVLSSSKEFNEKIVAKKLSGLDISFDIIGNANHFSVRKPAIDKIFFGFGKAE